MSPNDWVRDSGVHPDDQKLVGRRAVLAVRSEGAFGDLLEGATVPATVAQVLPDERTTGLVLDVVDVVVREVSCLHLAGGEPGDVSLCAVEHIYVNRRIVGSCGKAIRRNVYSKVSYVCYKGTENMISSNTLPSVLQSWRTYRA